jgi:hypothetical protein
MTREGPKINALPPVAPVDFGAKVTLNVTLCPGFSVKGNVGPLMEIPLPVVWTP